LKNIEKQIDLISSETYIQDINQILRNYQEITSNIEQLGTTKQKHNGIFYTNYQIAYKITEEAFKSFNKDINNTMFFEPSVGLGIFVITYLDYIHKTFHNYDIKKIINNIYISEIDINAVHLATKLIERFVFIKFNEKIKLTNIHIGDTLIDNQFNLKTTKELFDKDIIFDFILSNPPYRNIKASRKILSGFEYDNYRKYCLSFSKNIKKELTLQEGTVNLYKVFLELIMDRYTNKSASIGIIIPSSILSDKTTIKLRKRLLQDTDINKIYYLEEKSKEFQNITQAMCFFGFTKGKTNSEKINLINFENQNENFTIIPDKLSSIDSNYSFNKIDKETYDILIKIHKHTKLKDIPEIINLRGELDLGSDKEYITNKSTKYMLIQGKNINEWSYKENTSFVLESFLTSRDTKKFNDIKKERLVCQQISNMSSNKRLKFTKIPKNIIVGNSCNYIVSDELSNDLLLGLFNSYLFDWRFKLFSSNNHINNYELNDLPILIKEEDKIINYVQKILKGCQDSIVDLNLLIFKIYGLNQKDIKKIMSGYNDKKIVGRLK